MSCIRQIARGDLNALEELYEQYKVSVYRLVFSMTKSRDMAEDLTQDTFLRIQEKAGTYRFHTSEAAWIYTIARNLAYDTMRRRRSESALEMDDLLQIPSSEGNPEHGDYAFLDLIGGGSGGKGCGGCQTAHTCRPVF